MEYICQLGGNFQFSFVLVIIQKRSTIHPTNYINDSRGGRKYPGKRKYGAIVPYYTTRRFMMNTSAYFIPNVRKQFLA